MKRSRLSSDRCGSVECGGPWRSGPGLGPVLRDVTRDPVIDEKAVELETAPFDTALRLELAASMPTAEIKERVERAEREAS